MIGRYPIVLLATAIAAVAPSATAQDHLARDVEFVRNLATKLRFIDLAQAEAEALQKSHRDSADFKLVAQLGIEISLIGARAHPDREQRRTLFKEALEKSAEFIDRYNGERVADDARVTMVQACVRYGEFLLEEIEVARDEDPDQVPELEEKAAEIFRRGVDECDTFMKSNEDKIANDGVLESQYYFVWLNKAILQRENARAIKKDAKPLASLARETFENLILEIGEESLMGLRGWFEMSRVNEVLGDYEAAVSDFGDTIAGIQEVLTSDQLELSQYVRDRLFELLQEAYDASANALFKDGKIEEVLELCRKYRQDLVELGSADEGADPFEIASPTSGHGAFLIEARAMAESGDPEQMSAALALVQKINDAHPNDIIGIRAKSVLKDLTSRSTAVVSGSTLFEVAKGEYQQRNYEAAIAGFKRAYQAMDATERKENGLELWRYIGRSFGIEKRYAEATLAFARALEAHGDDGGKVEATAENLEQAFGWYYRSAQRDEDRAMRQLQTRVSSLITRFGGKSNQAKRRWKDATDALNRKKYDEAVEILSQVTPDSPYYEPAQARRISVLQELERYDEARKVIADYRTWLTTPAAELPADDKTGMAARRQQTIAAMAYFDAAIDYDQYCPLNGKKDPTKFPAIIDALNNFLDQHKQLGESYFPSAYYRLAFLHCELGDIEKAEEALRTLKKDFPAHQLIPAVTTRIFVSHTDRVKALETEYEAMIKAGNAQNTRRAHEALQRARRAALALGLDYSSSDPDPNYSILASSLNLAEAVKDWPNVEKLANQIKERFGEDKKYQKKIELYVQPSLCEALVRQKQFRRAEEVLKATIEANPGNYPLKRLLALTLGGWVEIDESLNPVVVSGLDRYEEAYLLMFQEYQVYVKAKIDKYSLDWYQQHWETYWFARNAAAKDTKFVRYSQVLFNQAKANEDFATLKSLGPEGDRIYQLFLQFPPPR
ncbi:MAG: hypothetical protein KDB80_18290 [Planctomycetes bacterium]|nr:hypothetical protein [Planctomycetota bacterium]